MYNYDRNNWLTGATFGNSNTATAVITPTPNQAEQGLTYDANGNIKTLQRTNATGTLVDNLIYNYTNAGKNQLNSVTETAAVTTDKTDIENQQAGNYKYDAIGQLTENVSENLFYFYNTQGLTTEVKKGANTAVKFFYNERGQRVRKESYNTIAPYELQTTTFYALDLSGNTMTVYVKTNSPIVTQTDLPIFGLSRLGVYNRASAISSYEITDHLGNVRGVIQKVSGQPVIQSFADYYPFGEQLPGRNSLSNYRYAFQGQELDGETGMEAFQLRLWDGRLGRWLSPDPYGQYSSPYLGMGNNPISGIDPDGGFWQELGNWLSMKGWHSNAALGYQAKGGTLGEWQGSKFSGYEEGTKVISDGDGLGIEIKRFNAVDDLWDNSARRLVTGDKIALGVSWDASFFGGGGSAIEFNWILTGKDKSFFPYIGGNAHAVVGTGAGVFADFTVSRSHHSGPSQAVSAKSLPGWEHGIELSGHVIGGGSIGYSYSDDGKYGWHTVTVGAGPGLDVSPLTALNVKYVASYNFLQFHTGTRGWYPNN